MNKQITNRFKSLLWRIGAMSAIALINYMVSNMSGFGLSPEITVLLGLIFGEVTKFLNVNVLSKK